MMKSLLLTLVLSFGIGSCAAQKPNSTVAVIDEQAVPELPTNKTEILRSTAPSTLNWNYFSGKYNIDLEIDKNQDYNGTLSFRMRRDSIIWFSITASIGFQIAKGIITKDSFHALDLLGRNYYRYSLQDFQRMSGIPADIGVIQKIFTGEVLSPNATYEPQDSSWSDRNFFKGYKGKSDGVSLLIQNFILDESSLSELTVNYMNRLKGNSNGTLALSVATESVMMLKTALNNVRLKLQLKTSNFDVIPSYPFNVPSDYKIME